MGTLGSAFGDSLVQLCATLNYSAEFKAVLDQMVIKPDNGLSKIYDDVFVKPLVAGGVWADLDLLNLKIAHTNDNSEALLNWINPSGDKLLLAGAALPTFNLLSGITGNGTSGYINTKFNPSLASKLTQNNACSFFYRKKIGAAAKADYGIVKSNTIVNSSTHIYGGSLEYNRINNIAVTGDSVGITDFIGLFLMNRPDLTFYDIWHNNVKKITKTINSSGVPDGEITEFAVNDTVLSGFSTAEHSVIGFGKSLSDAKIAILNDAINNLIAAINATNKFDVTKYNNSIILSDYTTHKAVSQHSEYEFTYSGTKIYIKANPTIYSAFPDYSYLTIYVDGVVNQRVVFNSFIEQEIILPAGNKIVKVVTPPNSMPSLTFIGVYPTIIRGFSPITPINDTVTDKVVFVGDSIAGGGNCTYPEIQSFGNLFKVENNKNVAFHAWGYGTLAQMAGDAGKVAATVVHIINLFANCTGTKRLVIAIGTNDYGLNSLAAATFEGYYSALLDAVHTADASIVITCISPIKRGDGKEDATFEDYRTRIGALCTARATYCAHIYGKDLLTYPGTDYSDTVHPSITGHKKMKDAIYSVIYP